MTLWLEALLQSNTVWFVFAAVWVFIFWHGDDITTDAAVIAASVLIVGVGICDKLEKFYESFLSRTRSNHDDYDGGSYTADQLKNFKNENP